MGERSWAAATLGEAGAALGGAVAPFLPRLGPALGASATRDPHPEVRSNALFAMGRLAEAAGPALDAYPTNGGLPRPGAPALLSHALPPPSPAHPGPTLESWPSWAPPAAPKPRPERVLTPPLGLWPRPVFLDTGGRGRGVSC